MKLKSLLLGSAAAMIAVSGARAADAVVAEAEPMEYVKVCDMYGAGFYYIPGTETCLRINGNVRVAYEYDDNGADADYSNEEDSTSNWHARARVQFDARNETDWGTLRSWVRLEGTQTGDQGLQTDSNGDTFATNDGGVSVTQAYIELGGLSFGYSDLHWATFHGYGNLNDNYSGYYGFQAGMYAQYTYAANGFTFVAGLADVDGNENNAHVDIDYYAGLKYAGSWGEVAGTYAYESATEEGAYKVSALVNIFEGARLKGWYVGGDASGTYISGAGDYAWGVSADYAVNSELTVALSYTDRDTNDAEYVTLGAYWNPVPGLAINPEVQFTDEGQAYSLRVYRNW